MGDVADRDGLGDALALVVGIAAVGAGASRVRARPNDPQRARPGDGRIRDPPQA